MSANKTISVLQFFGEPLSYGGQEAFILNMYKNFKNKKIKYTFATPFHANNKELKELIRKKNDRLIAKNYKFESKQRKSFIIKTIKKLAKERTYDVVHIHSGSIFVLYKAAKAFKRSGCKTVIVHSHATGYDNLKHKIAKTIYNLNFYKQADYFFACSKKAGEYKYSNQILKSEKFKVIKNGIDLEKFKFDPETRKAKRKELGLKDETVLCNVGRFSEEKNQLFLLDIFKEYLKLNPNSFLLLIGGAGPMEMQIKEKIKKCNLSNKVMQLKERKDIAELLCASDIFVFPSKFEGLGMAAIEAQASGLLTVCASIIPQETIISTDCLTMNLNDIALEWAKNINKSYKASIKNNRAEMSSAIKAFNIRNCAQQLEQFYV